MAEKQGKSTTKPDEEREVQTASDEEKAENATVLVLKGAATLVSGGRKFVAGVPQQVEDPALAQRLLASGLFETEGDKR